MGPPSPPPSLADMIEEALAEGELSDTASLMLGHLLMTPEAREEAGEPEFDEEEMENAEEEIAQFFEDLLDDDGIDNEAEGYINMMLEHMDEEHHDEEGDDSEGP